MDRNVFALALCNTASVVAVIGAVIVAMSGHDGWGWMLIVAVLCHSTPSGTKAEPEEVEPSSPAAGR